MIIFHHPAQAIKKSRTIRTKWKNKGYIRDVNIYAPHPCLLGLNILLLRRNLPFIQPPLLHNTFPLEKNRGAVNINYSYNICSETILTFVYFSLEKIKKGEFIRKKTWKLYVKAVKTRSQKRVD